MPIPNGPSPPFPIGRAPNLATDSNSAIRSARILAFVTRGTSTFDVRGIPCVLACRRPSEINTHECGATRASTWAHECDHVESTSAFTRSPHPLSRPHFATGRNELNTRNSLRPVLSFYLRSSCNRQLRFWPRSRRSLVRANARCSSSADALRWRSLFHESWRRDNLKGVFESTATLGDEPERLLR